MKQAFLSLLLLLCICAYGEDFDVEQVNFISHKTQLSGEIVFPKSGQFHAAVVFVHGSGKQKRNTYWAKRFAAKGIVALVYDKRGVGRSGGDYESNQSVSEKNITLLADDAIAALNVLREHPQTKTLPLGLTGISQAGWIAPLAAENSNAADFLVLWSGPVCKVSEEDIFSKYTSDRDSDEVVSFEAALGARKDKYIWPDFLGKDSDPSDSLAKLDIPGLWIFGEKDGSVPIDLSIQRLKTLMGRGYRYDYVLFSNLGHNNMDETFSVAIDWIQRLPNKN
ncbi:MAG: alpha/beta hydrolase [Alteromonadaceae bacterium]|nr:alpha/beta hydrolase [Alteromonadaceae bacterium]